MFQFVYNVLAAIYAVAAAHYILTTVIILAGLQVARYVWHNPAYNVRRKAHQKWLTSRDNGVKTVINRFAPTSGRIRLLMTVTQLAVFIAVFPFAFGVAICAILLGNAGLGIATKWLMTAGAFLARLALLDPELSIVCTAVILAAAAGFICARMIKVPPAEIALVPPPAKPTIYKTVWDHVTIIYTQAAYEQAMVWHRQGVENGYRGMDEKIVVNPCFVYYDETVAVGEKNRSLKSAPLEYFEQYIRPWCWVEERSNVYVPFASKDKKRQALDQELFGDQMKTSHTEAIKAIFGNRVPAALMFEIQFQPHDA